MAKADSFGLTSGCPVELIRIITCEGRKYAIIKHDNDIKVIEINYFELNN